MRLERVSRIFRMGEVEVPALLEDDLLIAAGELIVILGPSGSGKSTLLNLIGGMDRPTAGRISYRDRELTGLKDDELTLYRREKIGFIFQLYNLVPTLTALENVQVATELVRAPLPAQEALRLVGLEARAEHFPSQLSGGEQQRVAIARALAKRPELLLADEPTGALDLATTKSVLALLQELNRAHGLTMVVITHNPALTHVAQRVVRMVSGRIAEITVNTRVMRAEEVDW